MPPETFSVAILAGGFGTRLGRDKAAAVIAGRPLLHWTAERLAALTDDLIVVRRVDQTLPPPPAGVHWREAVDVRAGAGPLAGIEAALEAAAHDLILAVACDMPLVRAALARAVAAAGAGADVCMPELDGRAQPLLAAYRRSALPAVRAQLEAGEGRIRMIREGLRSVRLGPEALSAYDPDLRSFTNVNTAADLARVEAAVLDLAAGRPQAEE